MTIWITGATGMLGRCMAPKVRAVTDRVDITDKEAVADYIQRHSVTKIINCAAYTDVDGAENNPADAFAINAIGPENLGLHAPVIHFSTDYVFDGRGDEPYHPSSPTNPINIYGASKREGEKRLLATGDNHLIIRTSWLFGHGKNFVTQIATLLQQGKTPSVTTQEFGRPTYTEDLASFALHCKETGIVHFANQGVVSRYELASAIGPVTPVDTFVTKAARPTRAILATSHPSRSWQEALKAFLE